VSKRNQPVTHSFSPFSRGSQTLQQKREDTEITQRKESPIHQSFSLFLGNKDHLF
jgi:hypothetical protein